MAMKKLNNNYPSSQLFSSAVNSKILDVLLRIDAEKQREKVIEDLKKALSEVKTLPACCPFVPYAKKLKMIKDSGVRSNHISKPIQAPLSHTVIVQSVSKNPSGN